MVMKVPCLKMPVFCNTPVLCNTQGSLARSAGGVLACLLLGACGMNTSAITDARAPVHAVPASQSDIDPTHRDANQLMAIQNLVDGPVGNGAGELRPAPATSPETVRVAEVSAKPKQAAPAKAKPKGKQIRAVAVPKVRGAPGKGNSELTIAMRNVLKKAGWPVRSTPSDDTLTIRGVVKVGKGSKGQQDVVLAWKLVDPNGNVLGTIKQANKVPEGSINSGFGPNAKYAAQAAASGIFDLIEKVKRKQG
jgi:hypothetical protein